MSSRENVVFLLPPELVRRKEMKEILAENILLCQILISSIASNKFPEWKKTAELQ